MTMSSGLRIEDRPKGNWNALVIALQTYFNERDKGALARWARFKTREERAAFIEGLRWPPAQTKLPGPGRGEQ